MIVPNMAGAVAAVLNNKNRPQAEPTTEQKPEPRAVIDLVSTPPIISTRGRGDVFVPNDDILSHRTFEVTYTGPRGFDLQHARSIVRDAMLVDDDCAHLIRSSKRHRSLPWRAKFTDTVFTKTPRSARVMSLAVQRGETELSRAGVSISMLIREPYIDPGSVRASAEDRLIAIAGNKAQANAQELAEAAAKDEGLRVLERASSIQIIERFYGGRVFTVIVRNEFSCERLA